MYGLIRKVATLGVGASRATVGAIVRRDAVLSTVGAVPRTVVAPTRRRANDGSCAAEATDTAVRGCGSSVDRGTGRGQDLQGRWVERRGTRRSGPDNQNRRTRLRLAPAGGQRVARLLTVRAVRNGGVARHHRDGTGRGAHHSSTRWHVGGRGRCGRRARRTADARASAAPLLRIRGCVGVVRVDGHSAIANEAPLVPLARVNLSVALGVVFAHDDLVQFRCL